MEPATAEHVESIRRTDQALVQFDTRHGGGGILPYALHVFREIPVVVLERVGDGVS